MNLDKSDLGPEVDGGKNPVCTDCNSEINGMPFYPWRDLKRSGPGSLTHVDDPDGPFCNVNCQKNYDRKQRD